MVEARGPDIDFMNKQAKEAKIIDIAIQRDARAEKKTKYWISTNLLGKNNKAVEAEEIICRAN